MRVSGLGLHPFPFSGLDSGGSLAASPTVGRNTAGGAVLVASFAYFCGPGSKVSKDSRDNCETLLY